MADGLFYVDSRTPFISGDVPSVTLAATNKALIPVANMPVLGGNYFSFIGKAMRITLFGRITTAATPGNGTIALFWGTGADANGVSVVASPAMTLIANQTSMSWAATFNVRCRTMGATGTLFGTGRFVCNPAVIAAGGSMLPATVPAASASVDLTAAMYLSPQFLRSGSTVETMQVHEVIYEALN